MGKRWWITILVIIVALIVIGVLYDNGMLNFEWTGLTMFFAALAGPYTLMKNWLTRNKKTDDIVTKHKEIRANEKIHRTVADEEIISREKKIEDLNAEIEAAEKRIEVIEVKKKKTRKKVEEMSIEEMQDEAVNYFGS